MATRKYRKGDRTVTVDKQRLADGSTRVQTLVEGDARFKVQLGALRPQIDAWRKRFAKVHWVEVMSLHDAVLSLLGRGLEAANAALDAAERKETP